MRNLVLTLLVFSYTASTLAGVSDIGSASLAQDGAEASITATSGIVFRKVAPNHYLQIGRASCRERV